ncbi:MAG TPA: ABC transporter permease [Devosia sp.]|nr:ABC transporter permease [Devosia sp.]
MISKIVQTVVVLFLVAVVVFLLVRLTPGDPVDIFIGESNVSDEQRAVLMQHYGLDQPIHVQFLHFIGNALQGDLGRSITQRQPVGELILPAFLATAELSIAGMILAVIVGVPMAFIAAINRGKAMDHITNTIALFCYSMPTFWLGIMLILLLSVHMGWFPTGGRLPSRVDLETITGLHVVDAILTGNMDALRITLHQLTLPAVALAAAITATLTQVLRGSLIQIGQEEFIGALRSRGLSKLSIWRHMLRNAAPPTVIVMGVRFGGILGGAVVLESVFSWPGLGMLIVDAIRARDYPLVQGGVLVMAVAFVVTSFIVDILHVLMDPRIRHQEAH